MKGCRWSFVTVVAVAILGLAASFTAQAEEKYPSRPITIIVPYAPGGSMGVAAQALAPYMGQYLKTSIVISYVPGAGGSIGNTKGYQAKPDGYTLLMWYTLPPLLEEYRKKVGYETLKSTPIAGIARDYPILVGHPEGPRTLADFIKASQSNPTNIGSNGPYSITGLQARLMAQETGMKVNWVNFGGAAQSLASLAGKHIDAVATMTDSARPLMKAGKIIPLAIYAKERLAKLPDIPIPSEFNLNFPLIGTYLGLAAPPGVDQEKVKILDEAIEKATRHPDYVAWREKVSTAEEAFMPAGPYRKVIEDFARIADKYKNVLKADN